jgi:hypothetical protein
MADNVAIYTTVAELMPGEVVAELAAPGTCSTRTDAKGQRWYDLAWPNLRVTIRHFHYQEHDFAKHVEGFLRYVLHLADGNMDGRLWEIYYMVSKARQGLGLQIEPSLDEMIARKLITDLAEAGCGFVFLGGSLTDPWGNLLLGPGNQRGKGVTMEFKTASQRRERSTARLAKLNLTMAHALPPTVADEESLLREPVEVARRAVALLGIALRAEGNPQPKVVRFLQERGVVNALSLQEREFLQKSHPTEDESRKLTWRYEALWVLLWALGHADQVGPPGQQCDARRAMKIVSEAPREQFIDQAKLRPDAEILDELDFYYRAHWHVVNARQTESVLNPALCPDIIYERHCALNWLTTYMYQAWDDVQTDT